MICSTRLRRTADSSLLRTPIPWRRPPSAGTRSPSAYRPHSTAFQSPIHIVLWPPSLGPSPPSGSGPRPPPTRMDPSGESSSCFPSADDYVHVSSPEIGPAATAAEDDAPIFNPPPGLDSGIPEAFQDAPEGIREEAERSVERGSVPEEKKVLPEELAQSVVTLECESSAEGGICNIYLVGTAHVSQDSCREVQAIISYLKPQVVFLELCSSRISVLTPQNLEVPSVAEMIDMWKKKRMNAFGILYSWFLAKVANKLEVFPGSEFRVAFEEASEYGAKVILGDRPVHITLKRTWGKMTLWYRAKFLYYILFQTIFLPSPEDLNDMMKKMNDVDMLTLVIQEMSKEFPTMMETLVHERDMYMSSKLLNIAQQHSSVVAVVGKGHLSGIEKHWKQPIELKHLLGIPPRSAGLSAKKILASVGIAMAGVAVASGLYLRAKKS